MVSLFLLPFALVYADFTLISDNHLATDQLPVGHLAIRLQTFVTSTERQGRTNETLGGGTIKIIPATVSTTAIAATTAAATAATTTTTTTTAATSPSSSSSSSSSATITTITDHRKSIANPIDQGHESTFGMEIPNPKDRRLIIDDNRGYRGRGEGNETIAREHLAYLEIEQ